MFGKPKTKGSRRMIALSPSLALLLREDKQKQEFDRMLLGKPLSAVDLVFSNPDGSPLRPNTVSRAFEKLARTLGFKGIRFHDLRHAHATLMLRQGIHPKIVSERLGHSSVAITLDIYSHVSCLGCKRQPHTDLRNAYNLVYLKPKRLRFVSKMLAILPFREVLG